MEERTFISATEFCHHHHIELTFIQSLHEYGLIDCTPDKEDVWLRQEQVNELEKLVRLHYDLHINLEGLDAIHHLLQRMEYLQQEMTALRNRLRLHEGGGPGT